MPYREFAPNGAPCWIELFSSDKAKAEAFYGAIFGWKAEHLGEEFGHYSNFSIGDNKIAGCMNNDGSTGAPDSWFIYLATNDINAAAEAVSTSGGQVIVPPMPVMDLGSMSVIADPSGAGIGAWQPGTHKGFTLLGQPGTPNWFELHTRSYDSALAFYRTVFKWDTQTMSDEPTFRYTVQMANGEQVAGVMDATVFPEDAPLGWSIYFAVEDVDATLAKVVELGGSIVLPAEDTPYGRLAQAADPTGALFKVMSGGQP
jgi:uncharacterized protein